MSTLPAENAEKGHTASPSSSLSRILHRVPKAVVVVLLFSLVLVLTVGILAMLPETPRVPVAAVVVIDAGHGAHDPGAIVAGVQEKDVNLSLSLRIQSKAESLTNIQVILTRTTDTYPSLLERLALAEAVGARLYVSIHANYYSDSRICGVETWVDSNAGAESLRLAREVQRALVAATGAADRGVRRQTLYLRHTSLPTALVEVGYLSCPVERTKLLDPAYQEKIAAGILAGILSFLQGP